MSAQHPDLFEHEQTTARSGPVECLGMTFESDEAGRAHFLEKLREKLPELRKRPDFPVAEDEDILRLSDPPHYTACPYPFLAEMVEHWREEQNLEWTRIDANEEDERADHTSDIGVHSRSSTVLYHREPFAMDVSEGKTRVLSILRQRAERGEGGLSNQEIRQITHLDRNQAFRLMRELRDEQEAVRAEGYGRGARYVWREENGA